MITLDEIDLNVLKENFTNDMVNKLDLKNVSKIFEYLKNNGIYYSKDLFLSSLDLFLMPIETFVKHFEKLKNKLGTEYVDKLGEDFSLIEIMYED